ncbi:MAG: hypothetical protein KBT29_02645 [Prevotellaceae bacterium]|nr:hypothetical protein [Candidatus Minthosoma caballi]
MKTTKLIFMLLVAHLSVTGAMAQEQASPNAEYTKAHVILMHTPSQELYDGVIHPAAGLYDDYFDADAAADEHRNYISMLKNNDIEVHTVEEVLMSMDADNLRQLAAPYLIYDATATSMAAEDVEAYRQTVLQKMTKKDLYRTILFRPTVELHETGINTGLEATYKRNPLMNLYFLRDQTISTPCGQIMCRMNSSQRAPEVDIIEACYKQLGYDPVWRIEGEGNYLEGGDYIPFGTMGLIGCGLRTTFGAIKQMMEQDVMGHDTIVVVNERWKEQYQMHLDTYFNVIDKDLVTLCFNRYDAKDMSDVNFLTIQMFARKPGTKDYHEVEAYKDKSFKDFLRERGCTIIRVSKQDADHYANNFLAIDGRHIMSVANQSEELAQAYLDNGVTVEWVPLENLIGGYGAAHCMTQVLRRDLYTPQPTGVKSQAANAEPGTRKFIQNNTVLIQKDNSTYTVNGIRQ